MTLSGPLFPHLSDSDSDSADIDVSKVAWISQSEFFCNKRFQSEWWSCQQISNIRCTEWFFVDSPQETNNWHFWIGWEIKPASSPLRITWLNCVFIHKRKHTYVRKLAFDHFNSMQHKRLHRILSSRNVTCENCESARSLSPANCTTLDSCQEINLNHRRNICWGWLPVILLIPDYSVQNSSTFDIFKRVDLPRPPSQKLGTLYF